MKKRYFIPTLLLLLSLLTGTALAAENTLTATRTSYGMQIDASAIQNTDGAKFCAVYDENGRMLAVEEITADDNVVYCDVNAVRTVRAFALTETSFIPVDVSIDATLEAPETSFHVHTWDKGAVVDEPNCQSEGRMVYTCTAADCNESYAEILPVTDHTWGDWQYADNDIHLRICTVFDFHTETAPHNWESQILLEPTYTSVGWARYDCLDCPGKKTEQLPMLEPKEVWFTYDTLNGAYMINWLPAEELPSGHGYFINGTYCYPNENYGPTHYLYTFFSDLNLDPADITDTMDIVISTGQPYGGTLTPLYTVEDAIQVTKTEDPNFTVTGQTDGTYLVGSDLDTTGMTVNATLIHDDGKTELVTESYNTPYINIYPWDGSTLELSAMLLSISEDTKSLIVTRTEAEKVTDFVRPETPADRTVTTAEELQTALTVGGKVTLGNDITLSDTTNIYGGEPATLDLNGHTLTCSSLFFNHGKEMTIDGTTEGSAIVGGLYANNADKLTIHGGSYGSFDINWINTISLNDAVFNSTNTAVSILRAGEVTLNRCTLSSTTGTALSVNWIGTLTVSGGAYHSTATSSVASERQEGIAAFEADSVLLEDVTASAIYGSAVELAYGDKAVITGGDFTSASNDMATGALCVAYYGSVEITGTPNGTGNPDDLCLSGAGSGLRLNQNTGLVTVSDLTVTAPEGGCSYYSVWITGDLNVANDSADLTRITATGGQRGACYITELGSLTLEDSSFISGAGGDVPPAAISVAKIDTVTISDTSGSGGYYGLDLEKAQTVELTGLKLQGSTFGMNIRDVPDFTARNCFVSGQGRFAVAGEYVLRDCTFDGHLEANADSGCTVNVYLHGTTYAGSPETNSGASITVPNPETLEPQE